MDSRKKGLNLVIAGAALLLLFVAFTLLVKTVDVQAIGPEGSLVGFASFNKAVHDASGVHMVLYSISDWGGIPAILIAAGFAVLGLHQLVKFRSIRKVDSSLLALGVFYIAVIAVYLFFEEVVINYRPVLIEGRLEASYPSSTTLIVLCIVSTAMMQLHCRIESFAASCAVNAVLAVYLVVMVVFRLVSGVHWATDIIGAMIVSAALVLLYSGSVRMLVSSSSSVAS